MIYTLGFPSSYWNNVILGAESSQSRSHVTIIIQNFTLVSLTFTTMPHRVWLPFGALGLFLDIRTWLLFTLRTWLLTIYAIELAGYLCGMIRSGIICRSSTCQGMRLDHPRTSLSKWRGATGRLDATRPPPLCSRQPRYQYWSGCTD